MTTNFEQMVRERAYQIWMSAGMADGQADQHWMIAEQAIANEIGETAPPAKAAKAPTKKAAAPKAATPKKAPAKRAPAKAAAKAMAAAPVTH